MLFGWGESRSDGAVHAIVHRKGAIRVSQGDKLW
ncbi:MAG: hypothetical protein ACI9TP_002451 [Candidatus Azotimanducaceae bacterium]|jgi:hypothetical protein